MRLYINNLRLDTDSKRDWILHHSSNHINIVWLVYHAFNKKCKDSYFIGIWQVKQNEFQGHKFNNLELESDMSMKIGKIIANWL